MITINPNRPQYKATQQSFGMKYPIFRTSNVSDSFVKRIEKSIKVLPDEWGKSLEKEGYVIHCTDSMKNFFESMHLPIKEAIKSDAWTSNHPLCKFIVFAHQLPPKDTQRVVNHEISHGIVDSEGILGFFGSECIRHDTQKRTNQRIDSKRNLYDISSFLRRNLNDYQKNEIVADIFAWHQPGGGLWGSGFKGSLKDPDFLKKNFPITYQAVGQYEVGKPISANATTLEKIMPPLKSFDDDEIPF